jgi:hypothetical protein
MAMFPILQWVFRNDVNKREGIPQLAYGIEGTVHTHIDQVVRLPCEYISHSLTQKKKSFNYIFIGC